MRQRILRGSAKSLVFCSASLVLWGASRAFAGQPAPEPVKKMSPMDLVSILKGPQRAHVVLSVEFRNEEKRRLFKHPDCSVISEFDRFADFFVQTANAKVAIAALQADPDVVWINKDNSIEIPPAPAIGNFAGAAEGEDPIVTGGFPELKLTGAGVIIAIIDSGIDFRNPDFITYANDDPNHERPISRLFCFWDTVADPRPGDEQPRVKYPDGRRIGAIYSQKELTAELRALPVHRTLHELDNFGHGSYCASIAAGDSRLSRTANQHVGVATGADLIGVRIGMGDPLTNSYLLNAIVEWIHEKAGRRPAVISCSIGGQRYARDGSSVQERRLTAFLNRNPVGRILCVAAGNQGDKPIHGLTLLDDDEKAIEWNGDGETTLEIYARGSKRGDVTWELARGGPAVSEIFEYVNPLSQSLVIEIKIGSGDGKLTLKKRSKAPEIRVDSYISSVRAASGFKPISAENEYQIVFPGTCPQALTVGSFDFCDQIGLEEGKKATKKFDGEPPIKVHYLSRYSNGGYVLDNGGTVKPDFIAPGQLFTIPAMQQNMKDGPTDRDPTRRYTWFRGTSAATPYLAGIIALMLEKKKTLTVDEARQILRRCATKDGPVAEFDRPPNVLWGNGKIDSKAIERLKVELGKLQ